MAHAPPAINNTSSSSSSQTHLSFVPSISTAAAAAECCILLAGLPETATAATAEALDRVARARHQSDTISRTHADIRILDQIAARGDWYQQSERVSGIGKTFVASGLGRYLNTSPRAAGTKAFEIATNIMTKSTLLAAQTRLVGNVMDRAFVPGYGYYIQMGCFSVRLASSPGTAVPYTLLLRGQCDGGSAGGGTLFHEIDCIAVPYKRGGEDPLASHRKILPTKPRVKGSITLFMMRGSTDFADAAKPVFGEESQMLNDSDRFERLTGADSIDFALKMQRFFWASLVLYIERTVFGVQLCSAPLLCHLLATSGAMYNAYSREVLAYLEYAFAATGDMPVVGINTRPSSMQMLAREKRRKAERDLDDEDEDDDDQDDDAPQNQFVRHHHHKRLAMQTAAEEEEDDEEGDGEEEDDAYLYEDYDDDDEERDDDDDEGQEEEDSKDESPPASALMRRQAAVGGGVVGQKRRAGPSQ